MRYKFLDKIGKNKYGAKKRKVDGYTFHSIAESKRYLYLKSRLQAGEIESLELQPTYHATVNSIKIGKIILDFRYFDKKLNKVIIEDVKGKDTSLSKWKRKHVEAEFNIKVEVIK